MKKPKVLSFRTKPRRKSNLRGSKYRDLPPLPFEDGESVFAREESIINFLQRYAILLTIFAVIFGIIGFLVTKKLPKMYGKTALIEVGVFGPIDDVSRYLKSKKQKNPAEPLKLAKQTFEVAALLRFKYEKNGLKNLLNSEPHFSKIEVPEEGASKYIMVTARAKTPKEAEEYVRKIVDELREEGKVKIEEFKKLNSNLLGILNDQIDGIDTSISQLDTASDLLGSVPELIQQYTPLRQLRGKVVQTRSQVYKFSKYRQYIHNHELIDLRSEKLSATSPSTPKVPLFIIGGAAVGIFLALLISFFTELFKPHRNLESRIFEDNTEEVSKSA